MDTHSRTPRRRAAALLAVAALGLPGPLAGCGDDAGPPGSVGPSAETPPSRETPSPTETEPPGEAGPPVDGGTLLALVHATEGGGAVTPLAASMEVAAERRTFLAPLAPGLAADVRAAVRRGVRQSAEEVHAAVVAIGCEPPTALRVTRTPAGAEVEATLPKPGVQCFAPVTYVAVLTVPAG